MAQQYIKKPVVIEAVQFSMDSLDHISALTEFMKEADFDINYLNEGKIYIGTLEGVMCVEEGDYVIKGVKGEFYPCKPDIFELTYEKI